jgi:hypothetical protein
MERLIKYLEKLKGRPLTDSEKAILKQKVSADIIYHRQVDELKNIDPMKEPMRYLRTINALNGYLCDIILRNLPMTRPQLSLDAFLHQFEREEKIKLSKIRVIERGANGHS